MVAVAVAAVTSLLPGGEASNAAAAAAEAVVPAASAAVPTCAAWPTDRPCRAEADEAKPHSSQLCGSVVLCFT